MNVAITLARKGTSWAVVTLPHEASVNEQTRAFHGLTVDPVFREKFDEVQIWSMLGGRQKRRVFNDTDTKRVKTAEELIASDKGTVASVAEQQVAPVREKKPVKPVKKGKTAPAASEIEATSESLLS